MSIFYRPRNKIKVRSCDKSSKSKHKAGRILAVCFAPIGKCFAVLCCCVCCPFACCKGLWDAFIYGPKKYRNQQLFSQNHEKFDFQIGDVPGDKERQIVLLEKDVKNVYILCIKHLILSLCNNVYDLVISVSKMKNFAAIYNVF